MIGIFKEKHKDTPEQFVNFSKEKEKPMKKIVSTMLVFVVSLSLVGMAMAAGPKPPASICLDTGASVIMILGVKPSAAIKMQDGAQKFYSIQGALISLPIPQIFCAAVGSGYMDGDIFHFTLTSTWNNSGTANWMQGEGYWNVTAQTGTMYAYFTVTGNWTFTLTPAPCTDYDLLFQGSGAEGSPFLPRE